MKKELKAGFLIGICLVLTGLGIYLVCLQNFRYAILFFAFAIGVGALIFNYMSVSSDAEKTYATKVKRILSTYDAVLAKSSTLPSLEGKDIIRIDNMDDLIDVQTEVRKPICYFNLVDSCSFVLIDNNQAFVHDEKLNDDTVSALEIEIKVAKQYAKKREDMDSEMLSDIDNTTIVKLSNSKSYKVSPIRKDKKKTGPKMEKKDNLIVNEEEVI